MLPSMPSRPSRAIRRAVPVGLAALFACLFVSLAPRTAHAQRYYYYSPTREQGGLALGVDLEGAIPVNVPQVSGNNLTGGGGAKFRIGEQFHFPGFRFTPEVGYGYDHLFANDDQGNSYAWDLHRASRVDASDLGESSSRCFTRTSATAGVRPGIPRFPKRAASRSMLAARWTFT